MQRNELNKEEITNLDDDQLDLLFSPTEENNEFPINDFSYETSPLFNAAALDLENDDYFSKFLFDDAYLSNETENNENNAPLNTSLNLEELSHNNFIDSAQPKMPDNIEQQNSVRLPTLSQSKKNKREARQNLLDNYTQRLASQKKIKPTVDLSTPRSPTPVINIPSPTILTAEAPAVEIQTPASSITAPVINTPAITSFSAEKTRASITLSPQQPMLLNSLKNNNTGKKFRAKNFFASLVVSPQVQPTSLINTSPSPHITRTIGEPLNSVLPLPLQKRPSNSRLQEENSNALVSQPNNTATLNEGHVNISNFKYFSSRDFKPIIDTTNVMLAFKEESETSDLLNPYY